MMMVSIKKINNVFNNLIEEKKSREQIADWALEKIFANDAQKLIFDPPSEREIIWKALLYLSGVDLPNIDGTYLHSILDFNEYKKELDLEKINAKKKKQLHGMI